MVRLPPPYMFRPSEGQTCDRRCAGNVGETCGGTGESADFFMIVSPCRSGEISEGEWTERGRPLGCFRQPAVAADGNLTSDGRWITFAGVTDERTCHVICEWRGHVLSMKHRRGDLCSCGRFTDGFDLADKISDDRCTDADGDDGETESFGAGTVTVRRTWVEDDRCSSMRFLPYRRSNTTVLTSVPSSGNTWLRYLVEKSTGYFTGSVYRDADVVKKGYLGEWHPFTGLVKHHLYEDELWKYNAIVLVARNPYESMISEFKRQSTSSHIGVVSNDFIRDNFKPYDAETLSFLADKLTRSGKPMHVVVYDDLKRDPIGELRRLLDFPPLRHMRPVDFEQRLTCLSAQLRGFFKRKSNPPLDFDPFSADLKRLVNANIARARAMIRRRLDGVVLPDWERPVVPQT